MVRIIGASPRADFQKMEKAEKGELDSARELADKAGVDEETAKKAGDFVKEKLKQMN